MVSMRGGGTGSDSLIEYGISAIAVTAGGYLSAFRSIHPTGGIQDFWNWITLHSPDAAFSFDPLRSAQLTLRGSVRLILGGRLTQMQPDIITGAGVLTLGIVLVLLALYAVRSLHHGGGTRMAVPGEGRKKWLAGNRMAVAWVLSYMAFLWFWLPQNTFYRLFYFPALVVLLATAPIWRPGRIRFLAARFGSDLCLEPDGIYLSAVQGGNQRCALIRAAPAG